jgi:hypothetical protein
MKPILRRVQELERRLAPPAPAPSGPSAYELIRDGLARVGFVRIGQESLAETFARYLGITLRELRARLQQRAVGKPAELATDIG